MAAARPRPPAWTRSPTKATGKTAPPGSRSRLPAPWCPHAAPSPLRCPVPHTLSRTTDIRESYTNVNLRPGRQDNLSTGVLPGNLAWKLFYEFLVISLLLAEISLLAE